MSKRGLGRGLSALIPSASQESQAGEEITELAIDLISPNPDQPRTDMGESALAELADSVKKVGLLQPIIVRGMGEGYQIIAGERRWRACRMAGLERVPVRVLNTNELESLEIALIENLQREDLNAIEEARGYRKLLSEFQMTQAELADKVSKSRSTITNALRLLDLPEEVQDLVYAGLTERRTRESRPVGARGDCAGQARNEDRGGRAVRPRSGEPGEAVRRRAAGAGPAAGRAEVLQGGCAQASPATGHQRAGATGQGQEQDRDRVPQRRGARQDIRAAHSGCGFERGGHLVKRNMEFLAIGVIAGLALGFLGGLLLAPSSGARTRQRLADEAMRAAEVAREIAERAERAAESLGGRVEHYLGRDEEVAWRKVRELREGLDGLHADADPMMSER